MIFSEPRQDQKTQNYRIDPTEASTHESTYRPGLESRGLFKDYRNSVNILNEEYLQTKHNLDRDILESTDSIFTNRKSSVNATGSMTRNHQPKRELAQNNSAGKLKVYKIEIDGNRIRK